VEPDKVIPAHQPDDLHPVDPTGGESHLMLAKIRCLSACLSKVRRERVGKLSFAVPE
jgi:hypothetical protein